MIHAVEMEGKSPIPPLFKTKQAVALVSHVPTQGFTRWGVVVQQYIAAAAVVAPYSGKGSQISSKGLILLEM